MIKTLLFDFAGVILNPPQEAAVEGVAEIHKEIFPKDPYYFANHFELNDKLLDFLKTQKEKFNLCIFTSMMLKEEPELREKIDPIFSKIFSAAELQISKSDNKSYEVIIKELGNSPEEVFFVDDSEINLLAAKDVGIKTHLFKNNEDLINLIKSL